MMIIYTNDSIMCKLCVGLLNLVEMKAVIFDFKVYNDYTYFNGDPNMGTLF